MLAALRELARHPQGVALDTLAQRLQTPKSSLHRSLAALRRFDLVQQDERRLYRLSLEFVGDSIYGATSAPMGRQNVVVRGASDLLVSQSMLHYDRKSEFKRIVPSYEPARDHFGLDPDESGSGHFPASTYLLSR